MSSRIRSNAIFKVAGLAVFAAMFCVGCGDKDTGGDGPTYYTVILDPDGGEVDSTSVTATKPHRGYNGANVSLPTPTREGYNFRGWYMAKDGQGYEILGRVPFEVDDTLYAHWTLAHYTITFDAHGGEVFPARETTDDDWKLASLPTPIRNNHEFVGWYTDIVGEGEKVAESKVYKSDVRLYAHWIYTGIHYKITFAANYEGGTVDPESEETDIGGILEELPWPERDGYAFIGWFTEKIGGAEVTTETVFDEAATIYARWAEITDNMYKVTFSAHDGTVSPAFGITDEDGKLLTGLPTPTRDGHAFQGWFSEDGEITASTVFTADATIHARWAIIHYTITFDATGGDVTPTTATTGQHWELDSLPTPTRDGYTFIGWYTEMEGGTHVMPKSTALIDAHVIYAHWAEKPTSLVDSRDGKTYRVVAIGEQIWMAENLNYAGEAGREIGVCYDYDNTNCETYDRLYNWNDAMEACPVGWRLPANEDWSELLEFIGGTKSAGVKLRSTTGYPNQPGHNYNGTDDFGFSALPHRVCNTREFCHDSDTNLWWSSTMSDDGVPQVLNGHSGQTFVRIIDWDASNLTPVRCVRE